MAVMQRTQGAARKLARNDIVRWSARGGFVAYAVVHFLLAWLTVEIVLGRPAAAGDQSGAFNVLVRQPMGKVLLILVAIGLAALALWQLLAAAVGHRDLRGKRRAAERVVSAARTVVYAVLAWTASRIVSGTSVSAANNQRTATARLMAAPGGRGLLIVIGLVVIGISVGLAWYGLSRKFERNLLQGRMSSALRRWSRRLGAIGYAGKGAAYAIVGILLVAAAVTFDPNKSGGLDSALRTLAHQPLGAFLLAVVAVGFAAYGMYCLIQVRYRKV